MRHSGSWSKSGEQQVACKVVAGLVGCGKSLVAGWALGCRELVRG